MTQGDAKKALARPAFDRAIERVVVDGDGCWLWRMSDVNRKRWAA